MATSLRQLDDRDDHAGDREDHDRDLRPDPHRGHPPGG
jgi:hypothetical protein